MAYTNDVANACHLTFLEQVNTLQLITSGGTVLASITVAFGSPSVVSGVSTATVGSTPINFTWAATGTVGGFRWRDGATQLGEFIGAWAVGTVSSDAIVKITTLSATSGGTAQVVSGTHNFPTKAAGEP